MVVGRFTKAQALALRLIKKNGEKATLTRKVRAEGSDPWRAGTPTTTTFTVDAVFLDDVRSRDPEDTQVKNRIVEKVLIAGTGISIVPDPITDRLDRADGTSYEITEVSVLGPNEDKILYTLKVER